MATAFIGGHHIAGSGWSSIPRLSPHFDPEGLVQTHPGVRTHVERSDEHLSGNKRLSELSHNIANMPRSNEKSSKHYLAAMEDK